jgi:hypothetical protein
MKKADINKPAATMYPKARRPLADYKTGVLKFSKNNKIADKRGLPIIRKGIFRGYVIMTLTLEERATCPRYCYHWDTCYGNNMAFAHRIEHGPELEKRIRSELQEHTSLYKGVIVRLHVLGDFYSPAYVQLWDDMLAKYDNLAVWGFTGHAPASMLGQLIGIVREKYGQRFSVRFSDALDHNFAALSEERAEPVPGKSFACPEQTGQVANCASCAACWQAQDRQVIFATH